LNSLGQLRQLDLLLRGIAGRAVVDAGQVLQRTNGTRPRFRGLFDLPEFGSAAGKAEVGLPGVLEGAAFAYPAVVAFVVVVVLWSRLGYEFC